MSVQGATVQHLSSATSPDQIASAIADIAGNRSAQIALHEPTFIGNERKYVADCIDSGWVSSAGEYVNRFEALLSDTTESKHAIAVASGTAALHTCLLVAGIQREDEVLLPAMTFVATANAVSYCGAVPHLADIETRSLGIDIERLSEYLDETIQMNAGTAINRQTGRPIRALIVMHALGNPMDLDAAVELCRRFNLALIEDAAQAIGSRWNGRHVGNRGQLAAFSFNGNKTITCGGGGAVITNDRELAERARHLTTTARSDSIPGLFHDEVGYNYRMPNLNAALGLAQLETLKTLLGFKQNLASHWLELIERTPDLASADGLPGGESNHWLTPIVLQGPLADSRDLVHDALLKRGIQARPLWTPMHWLPMYRACPAMDLHVTESLFHRTLCLPGSAGLGEKL